MSFIKKIWKDRQTEYPARRSIIDTDGISKMVTVTRAEGEITEEGDAFNAENMNNLEERVANEFEALNTNMNKFPAPDYTNKEIVGKTYTATQDGWVRLLISKSTNGIISSQSFAGEVKVNTVRVWRYTNTIASNEIRIYPSIYSDLIPVKAGDQIEFTTTNVDSSERAFFPVR